MGILERSPGTFSMMGKAGRCVFGFQRGVLGDCLGDRFLGRFGIFLGDNCDSIFSVTISFWKRDYIRIPVVDTFLY